MNRSLKGQNIIAMGAEAIILDNQTEIVKKREKKNYRIKEIDTQLRLKRTRKEAKSIVKAATLGLNVPKVFLIDEESMEITMERIPGKKIRDVLNIKNMKYLCSQIGKDIALLHSNSLIHGDLTTSNMILNKENNKIFLIDFGLSFISDKHEDMAVDLHLFRRALESKHQAIWNDCWTIFIESYVKHIKAKDEILKRLEHVELRGRNKH